MIAIEWKKSEIETAMYPAVQYLSHKLILLIGPGMDASTENSKSTFKINFEILGGSSQVFFEESVLEWRDLILHI